MTTPKRKPAKPPSKAKLLHARIPDCKPDKPRLVGRPPMYTEQLADLICNRIANGESLRAICEDKAMPDRRTVFDWIEKYPEMATKHAQARARQQDAFAEDGVYIADTEPDPARARVRVAARQWYAERVAPKKYGNKLEHSGAVDGIIRVTFAAEDEGLM